MPLTALARWLSTALSATFARLCIGVLLSLQTPNAGTVLRTEAKSQQSLQHGVHGPFSRYVRLNRDRPVLFLLTPFRYSSCLSILFFPVVFFFSLSLSNSESVYLTFFRCVLWTGCEDLMVQTRQDNAVRFS